VTKEVRDRFILMCDTERGACDKRGSWQMYIYLCVTKREVRVTREVRDRFTLMCDTERGACDKRGS